MRKASRGKREQPHPRNWRLYIIAACAVVFVISGIMVLRDVSRSSRERRANEGLAQQVNAIRKAVQEQQNQELEPSEILEPYDENGILIQYSALYQENADLAGWMSIDGT